MTSEEDALCRRADCCTNRYNGGVQHDQETYLCMMVQGQVEATVSESEIARSGKPSAGSILPKC